MHLVGRRNFLTGLGLFSPLSADGPNKPFPAVTTAVKAYETYLMGRDVSATGPSAERHCSRTSAACSTSFAAMSSG